MNKTILALVLITALSMSTLLAGDITGYAFNAIGADKRGETVFQVGGGAESELAGGFGVTGELGYLSFFGGTGVGVFSPGVIYNFSPEKEIAPFATAGYSLIFRSDTTNAYYFGGGIDKWVGDSVGVRLEGRSQVIPSAKQNLLEARFSVLFR
jgi:hypothetical protein